MPTPLSWVVRDRHRENAYVESALEISNEIASNNSRRTRNALDAKRTSYSFSTAYDATSGSVDSS